MTSGLACGPGTGIDTKGGVKGRIAPARAVFYERLYVYVHSDRARKAVARWQTAGDPP